jgi:sigma-E factor negative regulatory protein RseC
MTDIIKHVGTVESIGSSIQVRIVQKSACSSCTAKSLCHSSESKEKIIDIYESHPELKVGDEVMIYGTTSMGLSAVVYAFVVPFFVLMIVLCLCYSLTNHNEVLSGVIALLSMIPYYIGLHLCKDRLKRKFSFTIKPIN